jgi:hypothetical protein
MMFVNQPGANGSCLPAKLLRRQKSGGSRFKASLRQIVCKPYLEKPHHKKGLVEWLKW